MTTEATITHTCGHQTDGTYYSEAGRAKQTQQPCDDCRRRAAHAAQSTPAIPIEPAADESSAGRELGAIERALNAAERLRDEPGRYFPARNLARSRMEEWTTRYPQSVAARAAEREARIAANEARRQRQYEQSFIGRGLD